MVISFLKKNDCRCFTSDFFETIYGVSSCEKEYLLKITTNSLRRLKI